MRFELVPVLESLRDLYRVPPGPGRFQKYLEITVAGATRTADVEVPPLIAANPMAKAHALEFVEAWLDLGAEPEARRVLEDASARLAHVPHHRPVKFGLTVLDDLRGGWTNRTLSDLGRFKTGAMLERTGWTGAALWTSEPPTPRRLETLRPLILEAAHRVAHTARHGDPRTVGEMLRQEGLAARFAGRRVGFDAEELEYSRAVIGPHLESTHQPTQVALLYGDEAARGVGYAPLGVSRHAGFEVALADALEGRYGDSD